MNFSELTPLAWLQLSASVLALVGVIGVAVVVWRKQTAEASAAPPDWQKQIDLLRKDLADTRAELQDERRRSIENAEALQRVLERNRQLYAEVQRQSDINDLLRRQLRVRGIELPPLPRELQDSRLDVPSLSIQIEQSSGGFHMAGGAVRIAGDLVSGDETIHGDRSDSVRGSGSEK